jgi:hypothetical protein
MEGFVVAGAGAGRAWPFRSMTTKPAATTLVTTPNSKCLRRIHPGSDERSGRMNLTASTGKNPTRSRTSGRRTRRLGAVSPRPIDGTSSYPLFWLADFPGVWDARSIPDPADVVAAPEVRLRGRRLASGPNENNVAEDDRNRTDVLTEIRAVLHLQV